MSALTRPRRPPVLDAARTALIPLRPLTIGEILDGGFLIVRRNIRLMIGLPLVVAGGTAAYVLAGVGLWVLLGNTTSRSAQIVLAVLMGLLGLLVLQQFLVWLTAILSRVSLQTVLGEGFAPATTRATWRASLPMFWPVLGLSLLQGVAVGVVQTGLTLLYYAVGIGVVLAGVEDETLAVVGLIVLTRGDLRGGRGALRLPLADRAGAGHREQERPWLDRQTGPADQPGDRVRAFRPADRPAQPGPGGPDLRRPGAGLHSRGHPGGRRPGGDDRALRPAR